MTDECTLGQPESPGLRCAGKQTQHQHPQELSTCKPTRSLSQWQTAALISLQAHTSCMSCQPVPHTKFFGMPIACCGLAVLWQWSTVIRGEVSLAPAPEDRCSWVLGSLRCRSWGKSAHDRLVDQVQAPCLSYDELVPTLHLGHLCCGNGFQRPCTVLWKTASAWTSDVSYNLFQPWEA